MTYLINDVAIKLVFEKAEYRCIKIIDDKDTKVLYVDENNICICHETSIDDVKYFKNITTGKKMSFYGVCDDADAYLSPQELIDVDRYTNSSKINKKLYSARLVEFKSNFLLYSTQNEKYEFESQIKKIERVNNTQGVQNGYPRRENGTRIQSQIRSFFA